MEVKNIHMTDEYAAQYLLRQGYLAGRIEALAAMRKAGQLGANRKDAITIIKEEDKELLERLERNGD